MAGADYARNLTPDSHARPSVHQSQNFKSRVDKREGDLIINYKSHVDHYWMFGHYIRTKLH